MAAMAAILKIYFAILLLNWKAYWLKTRQKQQLETW